MELKEFISKTLSEITIGIREGSDEIKKDNWSYISEQGIVVDFDINVSYDDTNTTGAGGKLSVANVFNVGLNKDQKTTNSNANRIKFSIGVYINKTKAK
ncbi:hypothetical protein [Mucilaginibacter pedocola]|uniref:Uncharacterized protein n=1 Tax=Mucilaginibacter pedocola TaxID=1792845 RepID=A0A1S9PJ10_9SPHI|nr:hypothetical protein [Mucilaginibacter pedocola]OOQ60915.1 hypothetical protein BC343_23425 [Mucilaginibacter pedocola]